MDLKQWLPMPVTKGPPLPKRFGVYWPWYKAASVAPSQYAVGDVIQVYIPEEGWSVFTILQENSTSYLLGEGYPNNIIDQNWATKAEFATYQAKKIS